MATSSVLHDSGKPSSEASPSHTWSFVLHGGCSNTYPGMDRLRDIKRSLNLVARATAHSLELGMSAKEAVVQAVCALEDCPLFNAGRGSALTERGDHELEAGIVDGASGAYGAVACATETKNPIRTALAILERAPHCLIVGPSADDATRRFGLEIVSNAYFTTAFRKSYWQQENESGGANNTDESSTVGAVVLDRQGQIAAGNSTGGVSGKLNGRVGDTAILGAGLYADSRVGVACSGAGDQILQKLTAAKTVRFHSSAHTLDKALRRALSEMAEIGKPCAAIAINADNNVSAETTAAMFYTASGSSSCPPTVSILSPTFPCAPSHVISDNNRLTLGLSSYPNMLGHTVGILKPPQTCLFSLNQNAFAEVMLKVRGVAKALCKFYEVHRCAFVADGGPLLSLLPLHGLSRDWTPVTNDAKEFHNYFPGYISSKDGPEMEKSSLRDICSTLQTASGIFEPFDYHFSGDPSDMNLFSRIVRGELAQWRIWEDRGHVAFLTPFGNTPGFTVLVPRAHLSSDIFSLDDESYSELVCAAHKVADLLKRAFATDHCGMIFEGFEIDYAHAKLIPIRKAPVDSESTDVDHSICEPRFEKEYPGYVTSLNGPKFGDFHRLSSDALSLRRYVQSEIQRPPRSWKSPSAHMFSVLKDPWYKHLFDLENALYKTSVDFFTGDLNYKYCFVPATTDSISSPMGLGSDSEPVPISLHGQCTHLADSMQFALEYFLRIEDGLPGVYYINTSFRGEDSDAMHLNQFCHVECELQGGFSEGISVAERYIVNLISHLNQDFKEQISAAAGGTYHLEDVLQQHRSNNQAFPQITFDDALNLPGMDSSTWKHNVPSDPSQGRAITRRGERKLIKHFGGAVWLTEPDRLSVPFYQAYSDGTRNKARCADLLLGNGEVMGLGERHVLADDVQAALNHHKVDQKPYQWYMDMRGIAPVRTVGWGMGVERFLAWVFQHDDIRDLSIIPRMKGSSFAP